VVSNVINKVFPKLALPLVQVVMGLFLGFMGASNILNVDPHFFIGFIIAPLLFRESEEADIKHIFKQSKTILILIFPLVFITTLGLGGLFHSLYATVPLAACFALGASLSPTDAVAVGAISKRVTFPKRIMSILTGEGLLNDASGLIAFGIAITALETGEFSATHGTINLIVSAVGGAAVGFIIVLLRNLTLRILEDVDARDVTGYLIIEFIVPLSAFLIAEEFHLSGIIAVVVAGVMQANGIKQVTLFDAQVTKVTHTIWELITYLLNSVVFLFLGIELHEFVVPLLLDHDYSNSWLIFMALILTAALFLIRFVIIALYYRISTWRRKQQFSSYWNDILLLTFSGSKGTISIATILLLPRLDTYAPSLLIFFCASVTALTFLTGLLVLPLLAAKKITVIDNTAKLSILNDVVHELENDAQKVQNKTGYNKVVSDYQERIQRLIIQQESSGTSTDFNDLQLFIARAEVEGLETALRNEEISIYTYRVYQRYIHSLEQSISHSLVSSIEFALAVTLRTIHFIFSRLIHVIFNFKKDHETVKNSPQEITTLYMKNTEMILESLENLEGAYDSRLIDFLQAERIRTAGLVARGDYLTGLIRKAQPMYLTETMRGYYLERKLIFEYEDKNQLTAIQAKSMRQNVNVMEDYAMSSSHQTLLMDFLQRRKKTS